LQIDLAKAHERLAEAEHELAERRTMLEALHRETADMREALTRAEQQVVTREALTAELRW
jgi:predicted  nucleic acid-binding Zn-ribbon protein